MVLYFFDVQQSDTLVKDQEGMELPDLDAAREEALQSARDILADAIRAGRTVDAEAVVVTDGQGRELHRVPLAEVLLHSLKSHLN